MEYPISNIYKERTNSTHYLRNNTWIPFEVNKEMINCKDDLNYTMEVKLTDRGPILDYIGEHLNDNTSDFKFTWEWLPYKSSKNVTEEYLKLASYTSVVDALAGLEHINGGAFGLLLTDNNNESGNIGYISLSKDVYKNHSNSKNLIPYGWEFDTINIPFLSQFKHDDNSLILNPKSGFIASANNRYPN